MCCTCFELALTRK